MSSALQKALEDVQEKAYRQKDQEFLARIKEYAKKLFKTNISVDEIAEITTLPCDEILALAKESAVEVRMCTAFQTAMENVREDTRKEQAREIAKKLIDRDMGLDDIADITGLSRDEILSLANPSGT